MDFGSTLRKCASLYGSRPAVTCEDHTLTFAEVYERACRLGTGLGALGLRKGDRVATLGDNMVQSIEEIGAFALAGLVRAPMYTQNTADVHLHMLNLTGARALIVQASHFGPLAGRLNEAPALEHVIFHGGGTGELDYNQLLAASPARDPRVPVTDDDLHIIRFSAGTTGLPKGIVHTTRGFRQVQFEWALTLPRMSESDVQIVCGPVSHGSGLLFWPIMASGARQVLLPKFDALGVLDAVERYRGTFMFLVPTMVQMLANHPRAGAFDLSSLRAIFYGGAPIAERTIERARALWGDVMYQFYGQSETLPATVLRPDEHVTAGDPQCQRRVRSAGRPTPNSIVKIIDEDGRELPVGEVGEIAALTPGAMKEVWRDPQATAQRIMPDGFIRTRDVGYLDEDGYLYIADRKEDMIISGGFNIWPAEIENALMAHPAILEAAVFAAPHEKWGETPRAVVCLRQGASASEQELIDWCRTKVGAVKKPGSVEFSAEPLPKNSVGKVLRRTIRDRYWTGAETRVGGA
jgi:acyl-CoA synthetase (AMP-forming)/AMP-acid ligase II